MLVMCAWYFGRVWLRFGTPFVGGWDPHRGFAWWTDPGYRTLGDFLRFGRALTRPLYAGFNGFWDGLYATLWGDGLLAGRGEVHLIPHWWSISLMSAGILLALLPCLAVLAGWGATLGAWVSLVFSYFTAAASFSAMEQLLHRMEQQGVDPRAFSWAFERATGATLALQALLAPLAALVGIYVVAAILHLVLLAIRGAPRGFDATLTVVGYGYGVYLLTALPMCGGLVAVVWFAVVAIIGLAEAQRSPTWKSALAVFSPFLLACLCACLGSVAFYHWFSSMQGKSGPTSL
jgi:hypothetical protein